MLIDFRIIAHGKQRYDTVGDYFVKYRVLHFRISHMKDRRYPVLVFLHEMIEFFICRLMGVRLRDIDNFDIAYEKARARGDKRAPCGCVIEEEPGDDVHAPYNQAHDTATVCEQIIAQVLGVNWNDYAKTAESLRWQPNSIR
jgi:hypothetical protein